MDNEYEIMKLFRYLVKHNIEVDLSKNRTVDSGNFGRDIGFSPTH